MSYANLFLPIWELGSFSLGNLDGFHLGTWLIFTWELGSFSLGNLDDYFLSLGGTLRVRRKSSIFQPLAQRKLSNHRIIKSSNFQIIKLSNPQIIKLL